MTLKSSIRNAVMAIAVCMAAAASAATPFSVELETTAIVVDGATPHGQVMVFSVSREQLAYDVAHTTRRHFLLEDEEGSGRMRFDFNEPLEESAVWVVVDIATGRHDVIARGAAARLGPLPISAVKQLKRGDLRKMKVALVLAELLIVSPGDGAWMGTIGDGGSMDDDGAVNGNAAVAVEKVKHIKSNEQKRLTKINKGDVVVLIDPRTLRWFISSDLPEQEEAP
jgi:hypothetical protein